jgi:hypothetical protein
MFVERIFVEQKNVQWRMGNSERIFNSKFHDLAAYVVILPKPFILTYLIHKQHAKHGR